MLVRDDVVRIVGTGAVVSNPPMGVPGNARAAIARYVPSGSGGPGQHGVEVLAAHRPHLPDSTRMRALGATSSCSGVKLARKFSTW